jgi:hypothetical protein
VKRESLFVLLVRGFASAFTTWKALLLFLAFNALLALALVRPVSSALHQTLDRNPMGESLLPGGKSPGLWSAFDSFRRSRPDVLGDLSKWEEVVTGEREPATPGTEKPPLSGFFETQGVAGALIPLGLLSALAAALFAGGFAGRFGDDTDRASLSAFGADLGRLAPASLMLGASSIVLIVAAYRFVYAGTARLYTPENLRYEWEALALTLLRLLAFLLVVSYVRLVVIYARASMGLSKSANPVFALVRGAGFVAGRPVRTLALGVGFGAIGLLPLALWGTFATTWDGRDLGQLALFIALQQLVVLFRIATRAAHLGAASSFLRRAAEAARPAAVRVEVAPAPAP